MPPLGAPRVIPPRIGIPRPPANGLAPPLPTPPTMGGGPLVPKGFG